MRLLAVFLVLAFLFAAQTLFAQTKLLRFPAVNQSSIVFTYAGDLYTVSRAGGQARKLTNHAGYECFARFSPDGKEIAFTGQYDGNTEVFLMPANGGEPKRLTYTATLGRDDVSDRMGPNNIVLTWRNDGKGIVFRSRQHSFNDFKGQLFYADPKGAPVKQLPFSVGGFCSFNADDSKLAYNRVFREFRTWKYYEGGMADDIHIYDFKTGKSENITNNKAQDIQPMWHADFIYYLSDRDRVMNLFRYDTKTKETKKITNFKDYDIKFASKGVDAIVFENGGEIHLLNLQTEKIVKVEIEIADDFNNGRAQWVDAAQSINAYDISPNGRRVLLGARGEAFTLPATAGVTRNLTRTSGAHERSPQWSPDGKWIAYISDSTGEDEIYLQPADGGAPTRLTTDGAVYKYALVWSPDSKKILWGDREQRLQYVEIESKKIMVVDQSDVWEIREYNWSPDSRWIAYTKNQWQSMQRIYVYGLADGKTQPVTEKWYDSGQAAFSSDGKYLFFVSNRDFSPVYSQTEWNTAYTDMAQIFFIPLTKETPSPLKPENDEANLPAKSDKKSGKKPETEESATIPDVKIDFDGIENRILALPIPASGYFGLSAAPGQIYYFRRGFKDKQAGLFAFNLTAKKEAEIGAYDGYALTPTGDHILLIQKDKYYVTETPAEKQTLPAPVDLSGLKIAVDKRAEWRQIYFECWRQMRDFFYSPKMHGVDWPAIRDKYAALLPYVNHRTDLTYLIGEMIAELNCGHAYANNGDAPKPVRVPMGLLGAQLERDASGAYQIKHILPGANWNPELRSPLTEIGADVKEGEFITAINGVSVKTAPDIQALLIDKAGKPTQLTVSATADGANPRQVVVTPIDDESNLYYYEWVQKNIAYVEEKTGGKVGYLHVPNMVTEGLNEFVKHFYPQLDKQALIIDNRGNGGGNVSPMLIERLRREMDMMLVARNGRPTPSPGEMLVGPKVALVDQYSASDGDLFTYRFKFYKLGTVIGQRTWGGTVGIRGSLPLLDGGTLNKPEFSRYDVEGKKWIIEGYGVDPDITVENDPAREFEGQDAQLDRAIEEILKQLKKGGLASPPPAPDKTR